MVKKRVMVLVLFIFSLTGCATLGKQEDLQKQALRNQISVLETRLETKDKEIERLKSLLTAPAVVLEETKEEKPAKKVSEKRATHETKSRPRMRQIQVALKNAGYNPGPIDGRMGKQTKDAIRAFQRANNLMVDGRVGKRTWNLLKPYLYKKDK